MIKNLGWRGGISALLVLIAIIYLVPSFGGALPAWWSSVLPRQKIHYGLDLQGGMHLVMGVEVDKAVESSLDRDIEELPEDFRGANIRYIAITRDGTKGIILDLIKGVDPQKLKDVIESHFSNFSIGPGPQKAQGVSVMLTLNEKAKNEIKKMAAQQAVETIRNRVDQFGVNEPDIRPQGAYDILIELPGIKDPDRAIKLIGRTAQLKFKLVDEGHSVDAALKGDIPPGDEILYHTVTDKTTGVKSKIPYLLKRRTLLTGEYLTDARVQIDSQYNEPYVSLTFDARGARVFERITGDNIGKRLAIVLDNNVYSAPVIRDRIPGGRAQITGSFTMDQARDLAIVLRAGALPAPVKVLQENTVGPSLGQDSIRQGFISMLVGGLLVIVFMVFYYGLSGVIADIALLLNILFIMSGLAFFGATLTLPGIAGIVLSIGMAVDANVLIFERVREELRLGKPFRAAIEAGYARAMVTILDANLTTFIVALVLFQFGTGPVKGFAVTLSIGLIANFVTAVFMTRIIFDYLFSVRRWKKISI